MNQNTGRLGTGSLFRTLPASPHARTEVVREIEGICLMHMKNLPMTFEI